MVLFRPASAAAAAAVRRAGVRFASTSTAATAAGAAAGAGAKAGAAAQSAAATVVGAPVVRRSPSSVRGGLLGFLLGFGIASAYGYTYLLREYNAASSLMLASVEELQSSTEKITAHLQRLNKLEADLKALSSSSATRADAEKNRLHLKNLVDGIQDEVTDLKKRVLDLPRPTKYMQ